MTNHGFYGETIARQASYEVSATCARVINMTEPVSRPVVSVAGKDLATFPLETSYHDIYTVARILKGEIVQREYTVSYRLPSDDSVSTTETLGESVFILGVVKDNVILMVYPDVASYSNSYNQDKYNTIKAVAVALGGKVESIFYRAYYTPVPTKEW